MAYRIPIAATAAAAVLCGIGAANAADYIPEPPVYVEQPVIEYSPPPYYSRVDCAASFYETTNLRVGRPEMHFVQKNGGRIDTGDGWACGAGFGIYIYEHVRADVTLEYRGGYDFDGIADPTHPIPPPEIPLSQSASVNSFVTLFNAYWDIANFNGVTPYVGAGIGFAYHDMSDVFISETGFITRGDDDTDFAYALMAGLAFDLSPDLVLDANYRFIDAGDVASGTVGTDGFTTFTNLPPIKANDIQAHEIRVGLRYSFY